MLVLLRMLVLLLLAAALGVLLFLVLVLVLQVLLVQVLVKRLGGGQPPSFPWHARPQSHEIQDFLLKFLLIFHQSGFLQRIL